MIVGAGFGGVWAARTLSRASADVVLEYSGEVTGFAGDYAPFFTEAKIVEVTIVLDETVMDSEADPDEGRYPGAVVSLEVSLPGLVFSWSADAGSAATFADGPGDQFAANGFVNDVIGSPVNGFPVRTFGVIFFGTDVLAGDALPTPATRFRTGNVLLSFDDDFGTVVGQATIVFAVPEPGALGAVSTLAALAVVARRARFGAGAGRV